MRAEQLLHTRETVLLDGAMGTMLQAAGLPLGAKPEALNLEDPALIESIHAQYAAAGSRILCANTFGASAHKLAGTGYTVGQVVAAGIGCARRAAAPYGALVALDVGPLGELLEPAGTLPFEEAVAAFAEIIRAGAEAGADLVLCETFTDLYELKAALLACKENCGLPGAPDARLNRLLHCIAAARQFVGRRAKGVGAEDTAARLRIRAMDGLDQGRVLDVQRLGLGPQGQARRLQHGAHGPVQQNGLACMQKFFSSHSSRLSFGIRTCPAAGSGRSRRGTRSQAPG